MHAFHGGLPHLATHEGKFTREAGGAGGHRPYHPNAAAPNIDVESALRQLPATDHGSAYGACAPASVLAFSANMAIVLGRHEVPDRCAYAVPVAVNAPVTSHVYFDAASLVRSLTHEPTLASVGENQRTVALVLNTSGASVLLQSGVCLTRALAYGTRLTDESLPPSAASGVGRRYFLYGGGNTNITVRPREGGRLSTFAISSLGDITQI